MAEAIISGVPTTFDNMTLRWFSQEPQRNYIGLRRAIRHLHGISLHTATPDMITPTRLRAAFEGSMLQISNVEHRPRSQRWYHRRPLAARTNSLGRESI